MKKRLTILVLLFFTQSASAAYCTSSNWKKLVDLFNKNVREYTQFQQELKDYEIKTYSSDFIHNRYTLEKYSAMWNMNNDVDRTSVEGFIEETQHQSYLLELLIPELYDIKKDTVNLEYNWKQLADYCYEEDRYKDYKSAYNNYEQSSGNLKIVKNLIDRLQEAKSSYDKEIEFFKQTKKLSQ